MDIIFDVESIGLHGEAWAVGWVVQDSEGCELQSGYAACPQDAAQGEDGDRQWVKENCPPLTPTCETPQQVRDAFWKVWKRWKVEGAKLWVECGWPVEANFLSACIADDSTRKWDGPYPLHEVATALLLAGFNPLDKYERVEGETVHHPLGDSRQSARLLRMARARLPQL